MAVELIISQVDLILLFITNRKFIHLHVVQKPFSFLVLETL